MRHPMPSAAALGALATLLAAVPASSGGNAPTLFGIRPLGMGDAFVAAADDRNALYYNPALLASLERTSVSGIGIQARLDDTFPDVVRFIEDHEEDFENFDSVDSGFHDELAPYDGRWVTAGGNAYFDVVRPGFGAGVYNTGSAALKIDRGVYEPRVSEKVIDDLVVVAGGGMPLGRWNVDLGGAAKMIWRRSSERVLTAREVADFDANDILDELEKAEGGFSLDLGARWSRPGSRFTAGVVVRDAFGFIAGEPIGTAFDLGTAWRSGRWLLAADLRDVFAGESFGNTVRLGAECRLPFVSVRGGFHQGWPTAGATLHVPFVSLDYAWYGRELGEFPGAERQTLHAVEARLGF